jgi:hypothetical protein
MESERTKRNNAIAGILLVGLGLLLLITQNFSISFDLFGDWNLPYPIYIIVVGLVFMAIGLFGGHNLTGLTIVGSIIVVSGALLAFQDATQSYQTWAYLWALIFPGSIGMAQALQSLVTHDSEQREAGLRMIAIALAIVLVGWSFFEGAINLSGSGLHDVANSIGPLLFIGIGGWLLLRRSLTQIEQ